MAVWKAETYQNIANNVKDEDMALPTHLWNKETKELRNAIHDDWKRKAIDSAKKRAAAAHVDYPTFANLVSVAHLKPVERKMSGQEDGETPEHFYRGTAPSWTFDPAGTNKSSNLDDGNAQTADEPPTSLGLQRPRRQLGGREKITDHDVFAKEWRLLNKDTLSQMAFLTGIDSDHYPEIFKVELPPNLLADILATIYTFVKTEKNAAGSPERQQLLRAAFNKAVDEDWIVRMLEEMTKCGRFSLVIGCIGATTHAMIRELISHLNESDWCKTSYEAEDSKRQPSPVSRIHNIASLYRVQIDRQNCMSKSAK
ncbi:dynein axonemal assembly factor 19 homolog isoform X1 [Physcomitrium patens]